MATLPPGVIRGQVGRNVDAEAALQVGRHRLAQRRDSVGRGVAVLAVAQRLDRRLDDVRRGFEVGLADAEVDDVATLALQRRRASENREGVFVAEARKGGDDLRHGELPSARFI